MIKFSRISKILNIGILICKIRALYYSYRFIDGNGKFVINDPFLSINIRKHKSSKFRLEGVLSITSHFYGKSPFILDLRANSIFHVKGNLRVVQQIGSVNPVVICLKDNSRFQIDGDFTIGQGVRFFLEPKAILTIGGRDKESDSGITENTMVYVNKMVKIGKDFICAWDVFITDSNWHNIVGKCHQADVNIGDHVWIAKSVNILKGTNIDNNCIVASNTKITDDTFPDNSLIGGVPAKIIKANIDWNRDII